MNLNFFYRLLKLGIIYADETPFLFLNRLTSFLLWSQLPAISSSFVVNIRRSLETGVGRLSYIITFCFLIYFQLFVLAGVEICFYETLNGDDAEDLFFWIFNLVRVHERVSVIKTYKSQIQEARNMPSPTNRAMENLRREVRSRRWMFVWNTLLDSEKTWNTLVISWFSFSFF